MTQATPLHYAQILRTLPQWSRQLPASTIRDVIARARPVYLDADGKPYPWYADAGILDREALLRALDRRRTSAKALQAQLKGLRGVSEFCAPLLQQRLGLSMSVLDAQYRYQPVEIAQPAPPSGPNVPTELLPVIAKGKPQLRSLLEAALHNFEGLHDTTRLSQLQHSADDFSPIPGLHVADFIDHCRALDLGQRYQEHLSEVYDGASATAIRAAAVAARQDEFRVQVRIAAMKGAVTPMWSGALQALCSDGPLTRPLRCWQIALFGVPIHELLLIADKDPQSDATVVMYWPDSPTPIRAFESLQAAFTDMRTRLAEPDVLRRLVALAPHRLQPELNVRLKRALFEDPDAEPLTRRNTVHLDTSEHPLTHPLWNPLEEEHVRRLKGDARSIAVPTADVDRAVRLKQLAYWFDVGLTVLNVAAMCVPMLNPLLLTIAAAQITGNVFEGIAAWEDGDNIEAMAQLESVLLNVAVSAAVVGGGVALQASGFVDAMHSITVEGAERLWSPSLRGYASETELPLLPAANAAGQYRVAGRDFVRIDGALYEQFEDGEGTWRVRHPSDSTAYAPALAHNGEGAWRLALERPLQWDLDRLLARLGQQNRYLDLDDVRGAWLSTGIVPEALQALHLDGQPLPALFKDAMAWLKADQRVTQAIAQIRTGGPLKASDNFALPSLVHLEGWPENHLIEVFDEPQGAQTSTLYGRLPTQPDDAVIRVSRTELEAGGLVRTSLDQMADPSVLDDPSQPGDSLADRVQARLAEHLSEQRGAITQRFYQLLASTLSDTGARLAGQFPGVPVVAIDAIVGKASEAERQAMLAPGGRIPLRMLEEARVMQANARLNRALLGLYRPTLANHDSSLLTQGWQAEDAQLQGMSLWQRAIDDRTRSAELIGQQPIRPGYRSPLALSHGRIGYPLSGRGVPRRMNIVALHELGSIYPGLSENELMTLSTELQTGAGLSGAIVALRAELEVLQLDLRDWARAATDNLQRDDRLRFGERLTAAWRRMGNTPNTTLALEHLQIGELPTITARFPHIRSLRLEDLGLQRLDTTFLERFPAVERLGVIQHPLMDTQSLFQALRATPNLEVLDLADNGIAQLGSDAEQALIAMRRLRGISFRRNRLILDEPAQSLLARLPLDVLNLSSNGIVLTEAQALRFQDLVHPEQLSLSFNPLGIAPDLRYMARLRTLLMVDCGLDAWPDGLTVLMSQPQYRLRRVELSMNRIHALPQIETLLATPYARDLAAGLPERRWNMDFNGMDPATRTRLRQARASVEENAVEVPAWQVRWRTGITPEQDALWDALFAQGENQPLAGVLERLSGSAEARSHEDGLRERVWDMLERASRDDALRQALNEEADLFPPTCGDAGADAFSALEVRLLIQQAGLGADPLLDQYQVLRQVFRREQVNALAQRIAWHRSVRRAAVLEAQTTGDESHLPPLDELDDVAVSSDRILLDVPVDEIEIRLALRQILADPLDYPESSSGMLYAQLANINARIVQNVTSEVGRLDQDVALRRQWLVDQPQWQHTLRTQHAQQFEALTDFWRAGLEYLEYSQDEHAEPITQLPPSVRTLLEDVLGQPLLDAAGDLQRVPISEGQYLEAVRRIGQQREETERGLIDSLTRAIERRAH
ncbi:NEL-type E3 ubiquitin ligase domain-containing protein [Pseudomonas sp. MLB6B]